MLSVGFHTTLVMVDVFTHRRNADMINQLDLDFVRHWLIPLP
jgi:hypothetical protein